MFTPRRTLLLLAGFVLFGAAYAIYSRFLGWLDGLPQLPAKLLNHHTGGGVPPSKGDDSPTQVKLARAFGPRSPETDYALYETQLEFPTGESSVVVAAGPVPANPESNRVLLTPFSLAVFGSPRPQHLRQPGEVPEITTVHSDKAILEFDRVIHNANDMRGARLVRIELHSDFGSVAEDPRRGVIHITHNQRSADPNRYLVVRTAGPVFYRDAKAAAGTPSAHGPDFWTDAPVEIVDRQNLPRAIGTAAPATAPARGEELRNSEAVADILGGRRAPPPTVTAVGLRVYLEPAPPRGKQKSRKSGPMQGVRRFEFLEQVVLNLWVDGGQSLTGGSPPPQPRTTEPEQKSNSLVLLPPPAAVAGLTGGLGPAAFTAKLMSRSLLQIETRGPFAYDSEKATARFDVVPVADPKLPNDVQVTKVSTREGASTLFSQVLEIEFNGGMTSGARRGDAPQVKRIHAWTSTPGRFLTVASENEASQAYGQDLVHEQGVNRTVLRGSPLYVVRDRNVLTAGTPQQPATLITEPGPAPAHKTQITVRGPGRVELFDASSNGTIAASWQTSLVQTKEVITGREQDLFVLTDAAKFEDLKADYWLKANVLKLWLESQAATPDAKIAASSGRPKPSHVQAIGRVSSHSAEYDIEQAEQLNVFFADAPTPKQAVVARPTSPAAPQAAQKPLQAGMPPQLTPPAVASASKPPAAPQQKSKPPMKIRARDIQTWVTRVTIAAPVAAPKPDAPAESPTTSTKYQLNRAVCEDNVTVHQDPVDPTKPRGIDILGRWLEVKGSTEGNILTVHGWTTRPGEVHQEEMSLIGPAIELDQLHNSASVKGRGALTMPTSSDIGGGSLKQPEVVVIHWRDRMEFNGAKRSAEFDGKVFAQQGQSWVLCQTMHVVFDRPIYFNPVQKRAAPPPKADPKNPKTSDKPKIDTIYCYPASADATDDRRDLAVSFQQVELDPAGKVVKVQRLRATELKVEAQAQDPAGGAPFQCVTALGPDGELRIWQRGDKEMTGATNERKEKKEPTHPAPPPANEQEMKLTVVTFQGRMKAVDKGKKFQQATFTDNVEAVNFPSDTPDVQFKGSLLPPRAVMLKCRRELVVWSHKQDNATPTQRMDAFGSAYVRTDEHEGWAESISQDGKLVVLTGSEAIPARVRNRFSQGTDQIGRKIRYDRGNGRFQVIESFGGTLGTPPKK